MTALENRVPPPVVVVLVGAAMWWVAQFTPHWPVQAAWRFVPAAVVFICSLAVGGSGFLAFRHAKTTIDPVNIRTASTLVTGGIFQHSRNPMYVGFTGLLTAWVICLAAPWAFAGVVAFVLFIWRFQIFLEERAMHAKFGEAYADYVRRVPRWL